EQKAGFEEDGSMNLQEIKELIKLIDQTAIAELSLDSGGVKVAIRKAVVKGPLPAEEDSFLPPPVQENAGQPVPAAEKMPETAGLTPVKSPMVGTFYSAPAPDAPPFVRVGDVVQKGQVLCIIEAMKLMNEIKSEAAGEIVKILVENGQPVEYGQDLFLIREK
ncbi:MAG: acetyl-CoA carboxylase biotin carboxyl carrier protein, partial [Moorella sp. (in: Bacteria)]|nr:acetyl-CoA carboxylase biotin carboxyl carrier protein [Moorella sp. (in: firmicutes)]